ncbi:10312_t:CDS:2 [Funneliformis geosporum]|nr:10312_t:CDS:2 [Funneliformis geosporum]
MNRIIETTDIEKVKSDIVFDISKGHCSVKEFKEVVDDLIIMLKNYEKDLTCFGCKLVEYNEDKLSNCDYCEKKFCSNCITIGEDSNGNERKLCEKDLGDACAGEDYCLDTNTGRRAYCHKCKELKEKGGGYTSEGSGYYEEGGVYHRECYYKKRTDLKYKSSLSQKNTGIENCKPCKNPKCSSVCHLDKNGYCGCCGEKEKVKQEHKELLTKIDRVGKNTKNGTYLIEGRKTKNGFVEKIKVRVNENEKNPKFKLKVVEENNKKFLLFDDLGDRIKKYPLSWTLLERTENDKVEYTNVKSMSEFINNSQQKENNIDKVGKTSQEITEVIITPKLTSKQREKLLEVQGRVAIGLPLVGGGGRQHEQDNYQVSESGKHIYKHTFRKDQYNSFGYNVGRVVGNLKEKHEQELIDREKNKLKDLELLYIKKPTWKSDYRDNETFQKELKQLSYNNFAYSMVDLQEKVIEERENKILTDFVNGQWINDDTIKKYISLYLEALKGNKTIKEVDNLAFQEIKKQFPQIRDGKIEGALSSHLSSFLDHA